MRCQSWGDRRASRPNTRALLLSVCAQDVWEGMQLSHGVGVIEAATAAEKALCSRAVALAVTLRIDDFQIARILIYESVSRAHLAP